jgi:hypothetical protein
MSTYENDALIIKLNGLTDGLTDSETTAAGILNGEKNRLLKKRRTILDAKFGQNRIVDLNRNQMKRNAAFTKVGTLTVISLGIVLLLRLFGSFIPEGILALIYVILVSACVFYGLLIYTDVNGRESTNFDRYNIPPPVISLSDDEKRKQQAAAMKAGDLLAASDNKLCSGQDCCDYTQAYEPSINKCMKCPLSGSVQQYYLESTKKCGACSDPSAPNYNSSTKACVAACAAPTPNWDQATNQCKA